MIVLEEDMILGEIVCIIGLNAKRYEEGSAVWTGR